MNRIKQAHDALAALVQACFGDTLAEPGAAFHRNVEETIDWDSAGAAVVSQMDDKDPEVVATLCGPIYDLAARPTLVIARRNAGGTTAGREDAEWADVEALKASLAADVTLGGAVEDARIDGADTADLESARWMGGGLEITVRLMFNAPSKAG